MKLLALETSCDETAAAVIENGTLVRSSQVWSQLQLHQQYGGVVPELAARAHIEAIMPVVQGALADAETGWDEIDAIAVTNRPGLSGALLVGVNAAKAIAMARAIPLIAVHHIEGHIAALWLGDKLQPAAPVELPATCLVVSGGHTELIQITAPGRYSLLGQTLDDAAGEAFDKGARLLGLGYPGGPAIQTAAADGNELVVPLPRAWLGDSFDFSFSGLKTALLRSTKPWQLEQELTPAGSDPQPFVPHIARQFAPGMPIADLAASFQFAITDVLVAKLMRAATVHGSRTIGVVGGVAANKRLRDLLAERAQIQLPSVAVRFPPFRYCTDNAAMIGAAGYWAWQRGVRSGLDLDVYSREPLAERSPV
ncbi:MAG TPA: tRNA (adenosine(37)-N6)-threonylcarbamoyltransferase complex transferase subunit TsaD [Thermomicrobiales bacterium]|nr:tRNA (adenosine(37)-N6)-threonylcarbamoyltransferase complex transferase subunit TsaD [Thermomicrobiales bacterium]